MADPSLRGLSEDLAYDFAVLRVRTGTTVRLVVKGEVDIATSPRLHEQIEQLCASDAELVVLDLERVTFFDSTGLAVLIRAHDHLNGRLRIVTSRSVARLLEITAMRDQLPIVHSGPEVTALRRGAPGRPLRGGH